MASKLLLSALMFASLSLTACAGRRTVASVPNEEARAHDVKMQEQLEHKDAAFSRRMNLGTR